jgi:tetratricopeptide (TPR) repeat protein
MLFDLRAPGRKRAVQAVYVVLALVLVGGTILFGVGTNGPGLFSNDNGQQNSTSLSDQNKDRLDALTKRVQSNPKDAEAWGQIALLRYSSGNNQIPETDTTTVQPLPKKAREEYAKAAVAWNRYVALNPDPIDIQVSRAMSGVFAPTGLNQAGPYAEAQALFVQAQEAKADKEKRKLTVDVYIPLLQAQYAAKRPDRLTKITIAKMRALTPKSQTKELDATIALAKNPNDAKAAKVLADAQQAAGGGTQPGGTVTLPDEPSGTTTTAPTPPSGK